MVVLWVSHLGEEKFFFVGLQVTIFIRQNPDVWRARDNDFCSLAGRGRKHADSQRRIDLTPLKEDGLPIRDSIAVGILDHQNPITFFSFAIATSIIHDFANPDPSEMIDIDIRRAEQT